MGLVLCLPAWFSDELGAVPVVFSLTVVEESPVGAAVLVRCGEDLLAELGRNCGGWGGARGGAGPWFGFSIGWAMRRVGRMPSNS